jgi:enhancing lycopene biosynthesis protein 2
MCIAPALLPKIYENVQCTIGSDEDISAVINKMGGQAQDVSVSSCCYDQKNKVISTPA